MTLFTRTVLPVKGIRSLCWRGVDLVDWVGGEKILRLDGRIDHARVNYAYRFDAVEVSPSGEYVIIFERFGTKALVLREGRVLRELNRSFYHAHAFQYPMAAIRLCDGREAIAHCPEHYNRIEIDLLETGERLTTAPERQPPDVFHSRLAASSDGRYLLSAGWIWHPISVVYVFDIEEALRRPGSLDDSNIGPTVKRELDGAAWIDHDQIAIAISNEWYDDEVDAGLGFEGYGIGVYGVTDRRITKAVPLNAPPGILMPIAKTHVVSFFEHPKVVELATGNIVVRMSDIQSGSVSGSFSGPASWPLAFDPQHFRFAIAEETSVTVVELNPVAIDSSGG